MFALATLVLAAAVAQPSPAAPAAPDPTPEGTAEDRALWRELREATNGATVAMGRIAQGSFRISYGRYYEGLDEVLASGPEAERAEAKALREALAREAKAADGALPARPGMRDCQYVLRDLGLQMPHLSERSVKKDIVGTRAKARDCVKRLRPLGEALFARADALDGALSAIDAYNVRRAAAALPPAEAKVPAAASEAGAAPAAKEERR